MSAKKKFQRLAVLVLMFAPAQVSNVPVAATEDDVSSLIIGAGFPVKSVSIEISGQPRSAFMRLEAPAKNEKLSVGPMPNAAPASMANGNGKSDELAPEADVKKEEVMADVPTDEITAQTVAEVKTDDADVVKEDPEIKAENEEAKDESEMKAESKEGTKEPQQEAMESGDVKSSKEAKLAPAPPAPQHLGKSFTRDEFFSDPDKVSQEVANYLNRFALELEGSKLAFMACSRNAELVSLYVGNLPDELSTPEAFEAEMSSYGSLERCALICSPDGTVKVVQHAPPYRIFELAHATCISINLLSPYLWIFMFGARDMA